MQFDVIIIGGGFAGLSAALQLGRARRTVLVIDAGERRNRFASASHGFLGRDGVAPDKIIAEATSQLARYVTVATLKGSASKAGRTEEGFFVETHNDTFHGKRLIIAGGVVDTLPDIPGLADRWGTSIFHCPYCHGYELEPWPDRRPGHQCDLHASCPDAARLGSHHASDQRQLCPRRSATVSFGRERRLGGGGAGPADIRSAPDR